LHPPPSYQEFGFTKHPTHPKKTLLKQKEKTDNPDQDNEQQSLHGSTWVCGKRERERERRWVGFALENDGTHGLYVCVCVCERERSNVLVAEVTTTHFQNLGKLLFFQQLASYLHADLNSKPCGDFLSFLSCGEGTYKSAIPYHTCFVSFLRRSLLVYFTKHLR
jgi:hypothetical protein